MDFIEFLEKEFLSQVNKDTIISIRRDSSDSNNLGVLAGVDLDSPNFSGYIYFWSKGFLDYALYNIKEDREEVPTRVVETDDYQQFDIIRGVVKFFQ
ncbi:hypothetical protein QFZ48_005844 [Chitinophaga sp. W2I13]|uniref:hypothetical protein n=1 Tax=Chitinophaga sp. W2I13 TaxID=3373923 RepID=UPI003D1AF03B